MASKLSATDKVLNKLSDLRKTMRREEREVLDAIVLQAQFPADAEVGGHQMIAQTGSTMKSCQLVETRYIFKD